uniref:HDC06262 n=1 Tax=Drosophila melanogaster TaxID=7227 RepID=Q6IGH4_DROME|nr:TPA_inf: HDC06262 [Drosophila melanogaster]
MGMEMEMEPGDDNDDDDCIRNATFCLQLATHLVATWGFPAGGSGSSNFWRIFGV